MLLMAAPFLGYSANQIPNDDPNQPRQVIFVSQAAKDEVEDLPEQLKTEFNHITQSVLQGNVNDKDAKRLQVKKNKLSEIRMEGGKHLARSLYKDFNQDILILKTFTKTEESAYKPAIRNAKTRFSVFQGELKEQHKATIQKATKNKINKQPKKAKKNQ